MAVVLLLGTATNRDSEADQITAEIVAERGAEATDLQLALYVAEHPAARPQHPTAAQPVRRRHSSTQPESAE
ncbi:hypothetical protein [Xylophilus sp. GOD-11R]|uniref:hypothetical protein n=1 Tax=Xylophilus sp. GOD-11R TaxID=3089814 RepID=UPI00298CE666|nr:hypothetical protein [Xylophilus sp. GOD-11R]WPB58607.1 hypothetical protein R9X41_08225 [Xylophilus sp. GOD-11R]